METNNTAGIKMFDTRWRQMARAGQCDSFGGAEYKRVSHEWLTAGMPENVAVFIRRRANIGPVGDS